MNLQILKLRMGRCALANGTPATKRGERQFRKLGAEDGEECGKNAEYEYFPATLSFGCRPYLTRKG